MAYIIIAAAVGVLLGCFLMYVSVARHSKKMSSLTKYVVFSIVMLMIYTIAEIILSTITGVSHDTLTTCFYAAFGGEILTCGLIKIFKLKEEPNE